MTQTEINRNSILVWKWCWLLLRHLSHLNVEFKFASGRVMSAHVVSYLLTIRTIPSMIFLTVRQDDDGAIQPALTKISGQNRNRNKTEGLRSTQIIYWISQINMHRFSSYKVFTHALHHSIGRRTPALFTQ